MKYALALLATLLLAGCNTEADVASQNLSKDADNFKIERRIVFYNGFTGEYMLNIEGRCALGSGTSARSITVTCKIADREFKKHLLGLSDNVTYFVEQLKPADVNVYHYKVEFKPQQIIPDVDFKGSTDALLDLTK